MNKLLMAVVVVVAVGVTRGMPIKPEPRQFVYQPGSPSVRLYPVHFEHYLKTSPGRVQMLKEGTLVMQGFRPNMLLPKMEKTERPSTMEGHMTTTTTTTTSITTTTTSEPKRMSVTTMEPMADMEAETTLQPLTMAEAEENPIPQDQNPESVTEAETVLEGGDFSALPSGGEEPVSATEIMPMMKDEEVEIATKVFHDENELTHDREVANDATVTELEADNEMTTEFPN